AGLRRRLPPDRRRRERARGAPARHSRRHRRGIKKTASRCREAAQVQGGALPLSKERGTPPQRGGCDSVDFYISSQISVSIPDGIFTSALFRASNCRSGGHSGELLGHLALLRLAREQ